MQEGDNTHQNQKNSIDPSQFESERKNTYLEENKDDEVVIQQQTTSKKITMPKLSGRAA